jgi:uncharacterized membrane protein
MTAPAHAPAPARVRDEAIDRLRALVMIVMALDHVRDFYGRGADPTDLSTTTLPLFFTRWITHFCAPVFVFLAGTAAFLTSSRKPPPVLARFLFTRGVWLIVLELTLVRFAWIFDYGWHFMFLQVIWAIGASMIVLAGLVRLRLSVRVIGIVGVAVVALHNLLDGVRSASFGRFAPLWRLIHEPGPIDALVHTRSFVAYPVLAWIGVMACGFAFGAIVKDRENRSARCLRLGLALCALFVVLRASNLYGDPDRWSAQPRGFAFTIVSFLDCTKYPPSLCYLLMTLGPAIALIPLLDRAKGPFFEAIIAYGRVPLFYYVLHLLAIHFGCVAVDAMHEGIVPALFRIYMRQPMGWSLGAVYVTWIVIVALLWWPSRWFASVKARRRDWWLGYL